MSNDFEMALMKSNKPAENVAVQTTIGIRRKYKAWCLWLNNFPEIQVAALAALRMLAKEKHWRR